MSPYGVPRTDAERRERHKFLFGTDVLPARGTGLRNVGTFTDAVEMPPIGVVHIAIGAVIVIAGAVAGYLFAKSSK